MRCQKVKRILLFHVPNKLSSPEKFAQNKLHKEGVQDVKIISKIKSQPCGDLVEQSFLQFNENMINNQDSHSEIENYETPGTEYPNENGSEETETIETSVITTFMRSQNV